MHVRYIANIASAPLLSPRFDDFRHNSFFSISSTDKHDQKLAVCKAIVCYVFRSIVFIICFFYSNILEWKFASKKVLLNDFLEGFQFFKLIRSVHYREWNI